MASTHPYISSGGPLVQAITQFRKSFPSTVDASTLKKLGLAPNNESYLINILKFLKLVDDDGNRTDQASNAFVLHKDDDFQNAFSEIVKIAYKDLFELRNDDAWTLDEEDLITYFRQSDQSTEIVGKRQAVTFKALAGLSGKREISAPRTSSAPKVQNRATSRTAKSRNAAVRKSENREEQSGSGRGYTSQESAFGLTVRVEINLPADGSQATYDRIFKSIKENLIDACKS